MELLVNFFAFLVSVVVFAIIRRYLILTAGHKKTNLPFIKEFDLIKGSKNIIFTNNKVLAVNAHDRHAELGDTFGCYFGENMQVFSRDLDLIYRICVKDFQQHKNRFFVNSLSPYMKASLLEARDNAWQTSRRAVGSVLKASKLKIDNVDTDIDLTVDSMLASLGKRLEESKLRGDADAIMDVYQINKNFVMQTILKIIFHTDNLVDFDKERNDVVEDLYNFVNVNYEAVARNCFLVPSLAELIRPLLGFFDHGKYLGLLTQRLEAIIAKTMKEQAGTGKVARGDQHPTNAGARLTTIHSLINSYKKGELSREQLMGNAVFLMLAGFATTVDTMAALFFELARNPQVQDKLRADLQQYGEQSEYLEQCINETLRLYPGAITNRDLSDHIEHKDFRLVKGLCFNLSTYSIHRDRRYWGRDAELWRPERFARSEVAKFHPAQFIPFGIGPRNCVGYNLAKLEMTKFAVQFVLRYKLETCSQTQSELQLTALGPLPFALPIAGPIHLKLTPTTACVE